MNNIGQLNLAMGLNRASFVRWSWRAAIALLLTLLANLVAASDAFATDLTWGGLYRVEAVRITNPELSSATSNKAYLLHHLVLMPKLIAADGMTVFGRLDILNNSNCGVDSDGRVCSVAGDVLGNGPGRGVSASGPSNGSTANDTNTLARTQKAGEVAVTSLYLSWAQEFGQLIVGRAPVQFGLGTAYSAGTGAFDHYIDTKDMLGYKIVMGNLFFLPAIGKVNEGVLGEEDDVTDYIFHLQYDNPETDLSLGLFYQTRVYTFAGNDAPGGTNLGSATGTGTVRSDGGKSNLIGLFSSQKVRDFTVGVEADLLSGDTGLKMADGRNVSVNAFGIAGEVAWKPKDSKLSGIFKLGIASGDDPGTPESYEGFIFSRNYDVAMLMFNHPLGQADFLRTGLIRNTDTTTTNGPVNKQLDTEAISNAIYFAPSLQYRWKENYSYGATFIYAMLNKDPLGSGKQTSSNLGWEVDVNLTYKPNDRFTWINEAGFLMPGTAWAGGTNNYETKLGYGLISKAAITF